jgi:hypothetical protein
MCGGRLLHTLHGRMQLGPGKVKVLGVLNHVVLRIG